MNQNDPSSDLRRTLALLRRRTLWILVPAIVAGVATYAVSSLREEQYRATSDVRVVDPAVGGVVRGSGSAMNAMREVATQVEVADSPQTRSAADERMGPQNAALVTSIEVSAVEDSDLIRFTATSTSAESAAAGANAVAETFTAARAAEISDQYTTTALEFRTKAAELQDQIDLVGLAISELPPDSPEATRLRDDRAELEDQAREFAGSAREYELEANLRSEAITVVRPATVPSDPFAPMPLRDALLAAILTALAAVAVVFLTDRLDRRVRSTDDLERLPDAPPVLGVVPDLNHRSRRSKRGLTDPDTIVTAGSPQAEAFRKLRSAVWLAALRTDVSSVLVTSGQAAEGKSLVSANLAVSLALSGVRVALVSADLRAPRVGSYFGIDETERGLSDVLSGLADLDSVTRSVSVSDANLVFVPAGPPPFDPGVLLGSSVMRDVITALEAGGVELVVLDSAPVGPVGDTVDLARNVDAALVVVRSRVARIDQVEQAVADLRSTQTPVAGLVLNGVADADDRYGYGRYGRYGYGYGYGASNRTENAER